MKKILYILLLISGIIFGQSPLVGLVSNNLVEVSPPTANGLSPLIYNFNITNLEPTKVYFDSNEVITASTVTGFTITDKTISSITINTGETTGHYFTVSVAFNFWANNTIRYAGGSNIQDSETNAVIDFDLQYITNDINEPTPLVEKYVTVAGAGTHNGTLGNEWTLTEACLYATAGDHVNIAKGTYSSTYTINNSGTVENPIIFEGYNATIKDRPTLTRTPQTVLNNNNMPYLDGSGSGAGISVAGNDYVIVRSIIADDYAEPFEMGGDSNGVIFDNVYARGSSALGSCIEGLYDESIDCRVINSYASDALGHGIRMAGERPLMDGNYISSNGTVDMDYYAVIYGSLNGDGNGIVRNLEIVRDPLSTHTGHGIDLRGNGINVWYTLVENSTVDYVASALELRTHFVQYCVMRNIIVNNHQRLDGTFQGIRITGAQNNTLDNITVIDSEMFVQFLGSTESYEYGVYSTDSGNNNTFKNCTGYSTGGWQQYQIVRNAESDNTKARTPQYNEFINCTFRDYNQSIYYQAFTPVADDDIGNKFINCVILETPLEEGGFNNEPSDWTYEYNVGWDVWETNGTPITGTGNISVNPVLDSNLIPTATFSTIDVPRSDEVFYDYLKIQRESLTTPGWKKHASE